MHRTLLALACIGLLLGGCGAASPSKLSHAPERTVNLPVQASSTAATALFSVMLDTVQDPFLGDDSSEYGTRVVGLHLTLTALTDDLTYLPSDITLILVDGETLIGHAATEGGLTAGSLAFNESAAGWLIFAVYADARPAMVTVALPGAVSDGGDE
jgi:hypothetical protein